MESPGSHTAAVLRDKPATCSRNSGAHSSTQYSIATPSASVVQYAQYTIGSPPRASAEIGAASGNCTGGSATRQSFPALRRTFTAKAPVDAERECGADAKRAEQPKNKYAAALPSV